MQQFKNYLKKLGHKPNDLEENFVDKIKQSVAKKNKEKGDIKIQLDKDIIVQKDNLKSIKIISNRLIKEKKTLIKEQDEVKESIKIEELELSKHNSNSTKLKRLMRSNNEYISLLNTKINKLSSTNKQNMMINEGDLKTQFSDYNNKIISRKKLNQNLILVIILLLSSIIVMILYNSN